MKVFCRSYIKYQIKSVTLRCGLKRHIRMNISEYIANFNEKDVIDVFSNIIKAESPSGYLSNREVDILDVEIFLDEYCVAIGLDGIADLIVNEYNKRAENYFGCVTDKTAKEMALSALREHFLYDGYTMYKADSPFASAFDWLDEKYKLLEIPLDRDGEQTMVLAFDFRNVKFDVDNYINSDWGLWNGEIAHIMEIVKERVT